MKIFILLICGLFCEHMFSNSNKIQDQNELKKEFVKKLKNLVNEYKSNLNGIQSN